MKSLATNDARFRRCLFGKPLFPLQGKPIDSQMYSNVLSFWLQPFFWFKGMKQAFRRFMESFCVYIKGGPFQAMNGEVHGHRNKGKMAW